jgi:hypothetical protein
MNIKTTFIVAGLILGMASCDRLLEFEPGDVILAEDAIQSPEDLQRLLVSNYDILANLYGGRVQIVNELRGPNFGIPDNSLDFTAVFNRETTFSPESMVESTRIFITPFTGPMWSLTILSLLLT